VWNTIEDVVENQRLDLGIAKELAAKFPDLYGIHDGRISTGNVDDFIKEVRKRMEAAGIPRTPYPKYSSFNKVSYVSHCKGHRNSAGELAEWCIKSHESGKIISSHKSEAAAKKHLQDMHAHSASSSDEISSVLSVLKTGPKLPQEIAKELNWDNEKIGSVLQELRDTGLLSVNKSGHFFIPGKKATLLNKLGRDALDILDDHARLRGEKTNKTFMEDLAKKYQKAVKRDPESLRHRVDYEETPIDKRSDDLNKKTPKRVWVTYEDGGRRVLPYGMARRLEQDGRVRIDRQRTKEEDEADNLVCICGHTRNDHDERGKCDLCECPGFISKENKTAAMGEHYMWEANGDEAVLISPSHDIRVLRFEHAQPFWTKLFELKEQIEDSDELEKAIDGLCTTYFENPVDPTTYYYEGYTNEPNDANNHQRGRNLVSSVAPGSLQGRIEKASKELAALWPKAPKAQQYGYAIAHHLTSVQNLLKQALAEVGAYPELAAQKIYTAESTLKQVAKEIKPLKLSNYKGDNNLDYTTGVEKGYGKWQIQRSNSSKIVGTDLPTKPEQIENPLIFDPNHPAISLFTDYTLKDFPSASKEVYKQKIDDIKNIYKQNPGLISKLEPILRRLEHRELVMLAAPFCTGGGIDSEIAYESEDYQETILNSGLKKLSKSEQKLIDKFLDILSPM
jgi:hypothetical protein